MVNIERHGDIKIADKPCLNSADRIGKTWNTQGSCTDGRERKLKPYNTSSPLTRNKQPSNYRLELASYVDQPVFASTNTSCKYSKSTISLSLGVDLESSLARPHRQSLDTLPYLELPIESRENHPYLAATSNSWRRSQFHSKSSIFGTRNLKLTFLCLLLSLLLLCKSCVCTYMCSESPHVSMKTSVRPPFLTFINETNLLGMSGQCLTLTGSLTYDICQSSSTDHTKDLNNNATMDTLGQTRTNFCGLPLSTIMSNEDIHSVLCGAYETCSHVLNAIQDIDQELSEMYCQFEDVLDRIDCVDTFSTMGDCNKCKEAYKQWLCSVYHTYYFNGDQIKPCIDTCDRVSESCPFFRPHGETLIGEPGFLCKDSKSSLAGDTAVVYGQDGCCYNPCPLSGNMSCPEFNITSNCTVQTYSSSSHLDNTQTDVLYVFWCCVISSVLLNSFPLYNIGLT